MDFKIDFDAFRVHAWYKGTEPPPGAGKPCIEIPVPSFLDMEKPQPSEDAEATSKP
jgi:hypothetical protein